MKQFYTVLLFLAVHLLYAMPTNDVCQDAMIITVSNCQTFDISGATASNNPNPALYCGSNHGPQKDIWFAINAPSSGKLSLWINEISGGPTNMAMEFYQGSCGNLTPLVCSTENVYGDSRMPIIELENLVTAQYYLRVVYESSFNSGLFSLCTADQGYTQYTCTIELAVPTTQSSCDPITNSYSQDIEIYYRDDGTSTQIRTNFGDFPLTGNPTTITLEDIPANSGWFQLSMNLDGSSNNNCDNESSFNAFQSFQAVSNCFSGSVANDECSGAIPIPVSSACSNDLYTNIGATNSSVFGCRFSLEGPQDIWFSCVVPLSGELIVNTWTTDEVLPIYDVYEGSCGSLSQIECGAYFESPKISNRTPGEILYIRVLAYKSRFQGEFGLCIIEPQPQTNETCFSSLNIPITQSCNGSFIYSNEGAIENAYPTAQLSCGSSAGVEDLWYNFTVPASGVLYIHVDFAVPEDPFSPSVFVEIFEGNCNALVSLYCGPTYSPIPSLQNRTPGETIFMRVVDEYDFSSKPYQLCTLSAVNDMCADAIDLTVGECLSTSNNGAAPSNNPTPSLSCGETLANDFDVWFAVTVPASGNLTIQTSPTSNTFFAFSMSLEAYTGTCQSLTPLACSFYTERWNGSTRHARLELENLTPNQTIYIRAADQLPTQNFDDFEICVTDAGYTNHACKIQYVEAGPATACDPVTNTFSQDITVHYYDDGTSTHLQVHNLEIPLTGSPMTVQITGLAANGNRRDIELFLTSMNYNECFVNSYYYKNDFFDPVSNCFNQTVRNDNCMTAMDLTVSDSDCETLVFDMTGATSSMSTFGCSPFKPNPQDVWFKSIVPATGELIINTDFTSNIWVGFEVYAGDCNNLNLIQSCVTQSNSYRLTGRTPGETIYIRVAVNEDYSDFPSQGTFGICLMNPQMTGDLCQSAEPLSLSSECGEPSIYSTHYALAEGVPTPNLSCANNSSTIEDLWFSITVPQSGDVTITLNQIADWSVQAELFESTCSSLSSIDCNGNNSQTKVFSVFGRTPGEILYLRATSTNRFGFTTFNICASSTCPDTEFISYPISNQIHFEDHISIRANNVILNTADVKYDAGQYILLHPGFEVKLSGLFHAFIDGCN